MALAEIMKENHMTCALYQPYLISARNKKFRIMYVGISYRSMTEFIDKLKEKDFSLCVTNNNLVSFKLNNISYGFMWSQFSLGSDIEF